MDFEKEITLIKERNTKVEQNKKWEKSWVRIVCVAVLTYSVVLLYSHLADTSSIFISSAIPVLGFFLSTLSISFIRKIWNKKKEKSASVEKKYTEEQDTFI